MTDVERLQEELGRAYRAIHGFHNARRKGELLADAPYAYHAPTIAAAGRFVREGALDGSEYFMGKPVEVLREALNPPPAH
jgi:hypothetical protein